MYRFLCGTPEQYCSGKITRLTKGWKGSHRTHSSHLEAFKCHVQYLKKEGFTQIGNREFVDPQDDSVLVLTKKSRFGGKLRRGKEGGRSMPSVRTGGTIIST